MSTPGGTTARPFALVTVDRRLEPAPPVLVASHRPRRRPTRTRANCVFSRGPEMSGPSTTASTSGRYRSLRPIILSRAGRMNTSNDTNVETGLPGKPK